MAVTPNPFVPELPREAGVAIDRSGDCQTHSADHPASGSDSWWPVPTWNLRTPCQSLQAAGVKLPEGLSAWLRAGAARHDRPMYGKTRETMRNAFRRWRPRGRHSAI